MPKSNHYNLMVGGEYVDLTKFLVDKGIKHRFSCPHTPQQNGLAERKIRHITELGLSMMAHASMPLTFWDEAFLTSVHTINRLPSPLLNNLTPYSLLYNKPPTYDYFRVFGCSCYPHLRPYNKQKFQYKSIKCTFLGYNSAHKGYRCLAPSGRVYVSCNAIFNESSFPYASISSSSSPSVSLPHSSVSPLFSPSIPLISSINAAANISNNVSCATNSLPSSHDLQVTPEPSPILPSLLPSPSSATMHPHDPTPSSQTSFTSSSSSTRYMFPLNPPLAPPSHKPPIVNSHTMTTRGKQGIFKPKALLSAVEPSSCKAPLQDPHWKAALDEEYNALIRNKT